MAFNIPCINCNKISLIPKYRLKTHKFCSRKCNWDYYNKNSKIAVYCHICKKEFSVISCRQKTAKYCSRKCYYKGRKNKGSINLKCEYCNNLFKTSPSKHKKFCSVNCRKEWQLKFGICKFIFVRKAFHRRGWINKCSDCGYDLYKDILGIHHIDHNKNNNRLENLVVLCPNCHSIRHKKHIPHQNNIIIS